MLTAILLPICFACQTMQVPVLPSGPVALNTSTVLIARRHGGSGNCEHGDDPNDEQHDGDLPANAHRGDGKPSRDPYNGTTKNGQSPWQNPPG